MATKLENYVQMAGQTAAGITENRENWTAFLRTASKLYRYQFTDQLLIHAQRPQATACAEFDLWNKRMRRYIRRGSKGIGLVSLRNGRPSLRYVFDIADTGKRRDARELTLWKYKNEYTDAVTKHLEDYFGVEENKGLVELFGTVCVKCARGFWKKYGGDVISSTAGSRLESLDDHSLCIRFCNLLVYSVCYMILIRCGYDSKKILSQEVFDCISDFNTPAMTKILGYAVSRTGDLILHQTAIAVFQYEKEKSEKQHNGNPERSNGTSAGRNQPESEGRQERLQAVQDVYNHYKPIIIQFLLNDSAYINACRNSDQENAILEGFEAVRRAVLSLKDLRFLKLYYDMQDFHERMQSDVIAATYPVLAVQTDEKVDTAETGRCQDENTEDRDKAESTENQETETEPDVQTETHETEAEQAPEQEETNDTDTQAQPETDFQAAEAESVPEQSKEVPAISENYQIIDNHIGEGGAKEKFQRNVKAIATLQQIEKEKRSATLEEQHVLSQYIGWGGIPEAFDPDKEEWQKEYADLKEILTQDEYDSAKSSVLNAHYTSPVIIKAMYAALSGMGFKSGNILEPSCGIGNFFGCLPDSMSKSRMYGVEIDSISGRIAKLLYPEAHIIVCGFENTDFPSNFFDIAIGNVPFGQYKISDPKYNRLNFNIHNYFIAKSLELVRPGGILAFITSRYTLDAQNTDVRSYLAERADLLGAVRLPRNAFKANAGTDVVSDIIFMQKRDTPALTMPAWVQTEENADGFHVNSYFLTHPEMVLGTPASRSTPYGKPEYTVLPLPDADLAVQLHEAVSHIHGEYKPAVHDENKSSSETDIIPANPLVKNYSFTLVNSWVYYRENSVMKKMDLSATAKSRVVGMIKLRDCVHQLISLQMDECIPDSEIKAKQAELNRLYDAYTRKYGLINDSANRLAFDKDSAYYLLCSLEILDDNGKLQRKADMFTKRTIKQHKSITHVDTASEALVVSIGERARVDLNYMSQLTGKNEEDLVKDLHGVIFKDPVKNTWQTADEYLSGNVRVKLRQAQKAAEQDSAYQINVEALEKAQPKDLDASEIEVRIGATWIDKSYVQQFMYELLQTPVNLRSKIQVNYSKATAQWFITSKNAIPYNNIAAYTTYGTERANAYRILEESLNLRDIRIYDTIEDENGKEKRVLNAKQTTLAAQKQQALRDAFKDWIFRDLERRQTLVKLYNELMNSIRPREYDGSHIVFSGINPAITLQPHQVNAIAHILYGGNTLLAHGVGAGKTFEMVAAAMEAKRLGLCHKSIFVVPNHLTEQTASEFLRLYPAANILVTTKKDFETSNRKKFCARIATSDIDAVIIGHSQFERIPLSRERQESLIEEQIDEITGGIREVKNSGGERFTVKQLEITKKNLETRLEKLQANYRKDDVVTFEELGVDMMFVDESDMYKNLFLYTKMRNVAGLSTADAQKSSDMFAKCRYLDEITGGRGIVFATGTPISNSMTEMYSVQRYLQFDRLQAMGMAHFDCWASRFGETVTALELAPEGTGYRARTRFAKFFNLPELMQMFREIADIKTADQLNLPVPEVEYHTIVSHPTEHQKAMVKELSKRAERVHNGIDSRIDNMLKITSDGRKLGLDQRLINPMLPDEPGTKVNMCVANVLQQWRDGDADKLTQLIFCDVSTPTGKQVNPDTNSTFTNIYDDIRKKLIAGGMAPEQIAFIHSAKSDVQKKELFAKVRSGQVRVLIGSTQKMGAGTNIQNRLIALHDVDCPWKPRDLAQRAGRIVRRGNENPKVHIYRYVTENTFDSYLWQTVENKQKFISQIMTSKSPVRSCEDVDETVLSFAEIKAMCAGDPRIKARMDLDLEVSRLKIMKADYKSKQYRMEDDVLKYLPEQIKEAQGFITGIETDIQTLKQNMRSDGAFSGMVINGFTYSDKEKAGTALIDACKDISSADPVEIGSYLGFAMSVKFSGFVHKLTLKGVVSYQVEMGDDIYGNITRINNALGKIDEQLSAYKVKRDNLQQQMDAAQAELNKPFQYEDELAQKSARLAELDAALNIGAPEPQTAA